MNKIVDLNDSSNKQDNILDKLREIEDKIKENSEAEKQLLVVKDENNNLPENEVTLKKIKSLFYFSKEFIEFIKLFENLLIVDLITCSLNTPIFINDLNELKIIFPNIAFNYSTNNTGNNPEGDWILESNQENIKLVYFNDNINQFKNTLALNQLTDLGFTYNSTTYTYTLNNDIKINFVLNKK